MKRYGLSTYAATLLLMGLALLGGVVLYSFMMGYFGGFDVVQPVISISEYEKLEAQIADQQRRIESYITSMDILKKDYNALSSEYLVLRNSYNDLVSDYASLYRDWLLLKDRLEASK